MTVPQRELLERLFVEALALPREQQALFLESNCSDSDVRHELESLLAFASRPLEGIMEAIEQVAGSLAAPDLVGQRVGPYRLTGRIGRGGMGAVYRAVRDDGQFQQTVAVKMLRFPYGGPAMVLRFRYERQILASLEHPRIARLLDGGAWTPPGSEESQPYIVMEYVEGRPLTAYCEEQQLSIRQRLVLFREVCDALAYAHRQLVIHRDVKPGNILVTADGTPKLLDFGVAKLLDPEMGRGMGAPTSTGLAVMTPDYASPEQVRGDPVSTVTDVYSLGAVLYELLAGRRPHHLATYDPLEIARAICESELVPPGINGDLDVIVLKAMQIEPGRRYQSVEQLSEDLGRYLEGLPIIARPDTLMYRAAKFARRHRWGLVAVLAVFLALVGGIAASVWEARRANTEAATAKAVNDFLQNDLLAQASASKQARPGANPDPDLKVRTALDRAAAGIAGKFDAQPLVEASIRHTIGKTYEDLGLIPEARRQMERALELRRRALGMRHPDTLLSMFVLGELCLLEGKDAEAEALFVEALDLERNVLGELHPNTLDTMNDLGLVYKDQGKYAKAEELFTKALDGERRSRGKEHPDTLTTMNNLAMLYRRQGKYGQAESLLTVLLEAAPRVLGEEHPDTITMMNNLGAIYSSQEKNEQAEALFTRVLKVRRRVLGEEHPYTLVSMSNLAVAYKDEGKYAQAEALLTKALETQERLQGKESQGALDTIENLAALYRTQGRSREAEALCTQLLENRRRVLGVEHPETLLTMTNLALIYRRQARLGEAEALLVKVLEVRRRVLPPQHNDTTATLVRLGEVRYQQRKYEEAEPLLREALSTYEKTLPDDWRLYRAQCLLGANLAGQKKYADGEPVLIAGYAGLLQRQASIPAEWRADLEQARKWIVALYQDWGKPETAAEWRAKIEVSKVEPR